MKRCGVYYLFDGQYVIYIGSTRDLASRISQHRSTHLDFAGFFFDPCPPDCLLDREAAAIREFNPLLNEQMVDSICSRADV